MPLTDEEIRELQAAAFEQGARSMVRVIHRVLERKVGDLVELGREGAAMVMFDVAVAVDGILERPNFDSVNPYRDLADARKELA